jgi:hypothetical protein
MDGGQSQLFFRKYICWLKMQLFILALQSISHPHNLAFILFENRFNRSVLSKSKLTLRIQKPISYFPVLVL